MRVNLAARCSWVLGLCLVCATCSPEVKRSPGRSALLITIDTVRIDALGCYSDRAKVTPRIDELAKQSLRYIWARTAIPVTLPSHTSIMTGLYPARHGVRDNGVVALSESATTLAERARAAGLATAAFVSAAVLDPGFGLAQGFDVYDAPARTVDHGRTQGIERAGSETVERARAWLAQRDHGRDFFLWVHLYDPHDPYDPPKLFLERAGGVAYLGEIAAADDAAGHLIDALREDGGLATTFVILTADHGEGLGAHGEETHANFLYDTTLRVPLLLRYPDAWRAGETAGEIVSTVDIYPTLVEALGLDGPGDVDGVSLFRRAAPTERGVYAESYYGYLHFGWSPITTWARSNGKYIHSPRPEWFDAATDTGERKNLFGSPGIDVAPAKSAIAAVVARPALANGGARVNSGLTRAVEALGYAGGSDGRMDLPHPLAPSDRPSPHACAEELDRIGRAQILIKQRNYDAAIVLLNEIVAANAGNAAALDLLAFALIETGHCDRAVDVLRKVAGSQSARAQTHVALGHCLHLQGHATEAEAEFRAALALDANNTTALEHLAEVLEERGAADEAQRCRARVAELGVEH
jgi:arylsulfatase A-like enzyme/Tfp pilus assembly protein PilF